MKTMTLICLFVTIGFLGIAQEIEQEQTFEFESLKKNSYLGEVTYDSENQTTALHYVQKKLTSTLFSSYIFDKDLNFLEEQQEEITLSDELRAFKDNFGWFAEKYEGEEYSEEYVRLAQGLNGNIIIDKYRYDYVFDWGYGKYFPEVRHAERENLKGEKAERLYLYDWIQLNHEGDALLLAGIKAPKGSKVKFQQARKFQLIKISKDFKVEYLETISFKYNTAVTFMCLLTYEEPETVVGSNFAGEEEVFVIPPDGEDGKLAIMFTPIKSMLGKKQNGDNPAKQQLVLVNLDGTIDAKINFTAPVSGWVIEDFILSDQENEFYLYGPAKEDAYVNQLMPTRSPLTARQEIKDIKWKSFQLMKVSNGEMEWIKATDLKEFKDKAVAPPSQKQMPIYRGEKFVKTMTYVSPSGEVFIGGQNYKKALMKEVENESRPEAYKDLVLFHFNEKGALKAQYGVRRDKMNAHSKAFPTPQDLCLSKDGESLYWIYGEIKGVKGGFVLSEDIGTLSKAKLLYYPAVAKINLAKAEVSDFSTFGKGEDDKQIYFAHPDYSHIVTDEHLLFLGEDKSGKTIWMGKMGL